MKITNLTINSRQAVKEDALLKATNTFSKKELVKNQLFDAIHSSQLINKDPKVKQQVMNSLCKLALCNKNKLSLFLEYKQCPQAFKDVFPPEKIDKLYLLISLLNSKDNTEQIPNANTGSREVAVANEDKSQLLYDTMRGVAAILKCEVNFPDASDLQINRLTISQKNGNQPSQQDLVKENLVNALTNNTSDDFKLLAKLFDLPQNLNPRAEAATITAKYLDLTSKVNNMGLLDKVSQSLGNLFPRMATKVMSQDSWVNDFKTFSQQAGNANNPNQLTDNFKLPAYRNLKQQAYFTKLEKITGIQPNELQKLPLTVEVQTLLALKNILNKADTVDKVRDTAEILNNVSKLVLATATLGLSELGVYIFKESIKQLAAYSLEQGLKQITNQALNATNINTSLNLLDKYASSMSTIVNGFNSIVDKLPETIKNKLKPALMEWATNLSNVNKQIALIKLLQKVAQLTIATQTQQMNALIIENSLKGGDVTEMSTMLGLLQQQLDDLKSSQDSTAENQRQALEATITSIKAQQAVSENEIANAPSKLQDQQNNAVSAEKIDQEGQKFRSAKSLDIQAALNRLPDEVKNLLNIPFNAEGILPAAFEGGNIGDASLGGVLNYFSNQSSNPNVELGLLLYATGDILNKLTSTTIESAKNFTDVYEEIVGSTTEYISKFVGFKLADKNFQKTIRENQQLSAAHTDKRNAYSSKVKEFVNQGITSLDEANTKYKKAVYTFISESLTKGIRSQIQQMKQNNQLDATAMSTLEAHEKALVDFCKDMTANFDSAVDNARLTQVMQAAQYFEDNFPNHEA